MRAAMWAGSSPGKASYSRTWTILRGFGLAGRLALMGLRRSRGTTALAASVLTLGLAAPVIFISILAGAVRPLPVPEGDRVVRVDVTRPASGGGEVPVTLADLRTLRDASFLESLGGFRLVGGTLADAQITAVRVSAALLTSEVLPLLRIEPVLGRLPAPEEPVAGFLIGFQLWQDSYAGDPAVLGRTVRLNDDSGVIVGVLPDGFGFPFRQNVWALLEERVGDDEPVDLVGRLAVGASSEAASVELGARWARADDLRDPTRRGGVLEVDAFTGGRGEPGEGVAYFGLVLVGLALLIIACANVANLLLVRAAERVRGLGVQSALGANRVQLSAQLFLESLFLSVLGGVGGLALAWIGVEAIQRTLAAEHFGYFWMRMAVDGTVLAFASVLVGGTAVFAGTLPMVRIMGADLQGVLKEGSSDLVVRGGGLGSRVFVSAQLVVSCAALVAALLAGRSLTQSRDFGKGVPSEEILVASLDLGSGLDSPVQGPGTPQRLTEALGVVPGSRFVALAAGAPGYFEPRGPFEIEGREAQRAVGLQQAYWNAVTPQFFPLLDLEIRRGRGFVVEDDGESSPVALVSAAFAEGHSAGEDVLGRRIKVPGSGSQEWFTVIGVVEDLDMGGGSTVPRERIYLPLFQLPEATSMVLLRSTADAASLSTGLRRAVRDTDPDIALWSVQTLADAHAYMIRVPRAMATLASLGGLAGLLVAATGLYGLLAFRVRRRRREFGVRMALGADGRRLAGDVLKFAVRQLLPALAVGLLLAWLAAPILGAVLLNRDLRSPATYLAVGAVFLGVGLSAALLPALRAASVDPAEVLRSE